MKIAYCLLVAIGLLLPARSANADAFYTKKSGSAVDITVWKAVRSGTISITAGSAHVVGDMTVFSEIYLPAAGYANITDSTGTVVLGTVASIEDDARLTLTEPAAASYSGAFTTESLPTIDDDLTINAEHAITAMAAEVGSSAFGIHNITIDGTLSTDVVYLEITGDLAINTGGMLTTDPNTRLVFDGVSTIGGSAPISIDYLRVKAPGVVTLSKNITVARILEMEGGRIVTGTDTLTLGSSFTSPGTLQFTGTGTSGMIVGTMKRWIASDSIAMGCLSGLFPLGTGTEFRKVWIAKSHTGTGTITVSHTNAASTTSFDVPFVENSLTFDTRHNISWTIATGDGYTGTTDLRVQASGIDAGAYPPENMTLSLAGGEASGNYATPMIVNADTVVNRAGLTETQLSNTFYIASGSSAMPVELVAFTAAARGKSIVLQWKTATEKNNAGFEIERSPAATERRWTKVGFVEGHGTTNAPQAYVFADQSAGGVYAYRLKQIDRDGRWEYSREAVASALPPGGYELGQNYPNPFNPSTTIRFAVDAPGRAVLRVYNTLGQEVCTLFDGVVTGNTMQTIVFDARNLPSGMYFYTLKAGGRSEARRMQLVR